MNRRAFLRSLAVLTGGAAVTVVSEPASARRGRPATPNSVAGVRRRTGRRTRHRIYRNQRLHSLPYGCNTTRYRGSVRYYYCGGVWYRPAYEGTTLIYIVDDIEAGASTDVEFEE